jgi:hypothetical protein
LQWTAAAEFHQGVCYLAHDRRPIRILQYMSESPGVVSRLVYDQSAVDDKENSQGSGAFC